MYSSLILMSGKLVTCLINVEFAAAAAAFARGVYISFTISSYIY